MCSATCLTGTTLITLQCNSVTPCKDARNGASLNVCCPQPLNSLATYTVTGGCVFACNTGYASPSTQQNVCCPTVKNGTITYINNVCGFTCNPGYIISGTNTCLPLSEAIDVPAYTRAENNMKNTIQFVEAAPRVPEFRIQVSNYEVSLRNKVASLDTTQIPSEKLLPSSSLAETSLRTKMSRDSVITVQEKFISSNPAVLKLANIEETILEQNEGPCSSNFYIKNNQCFPCPSISYSPAGSSTCITCPSNSTMKTTRDGCTCTSTLTNGTYTYDTTTNTCIPGCNPGYTLTNGMCQLTDCVKAGGTQFAYTTTSPTFACTQGTSAQASVSFTSGTAPCKLAPSVNDATSFYYILGTNSIPAFVTAITATTATITTATGVCCASGSYSVASGTSWACGACTPATCPAAGANATLTQGGCSGATNRSCTYTCSAGYAKASTDTTACTQCTSTVPNGAYTYNTSTTTCVPGCNSGYYNSGSVSGVPTCTSCGSCTTSVPNATAACTTTACSVQCASGYYASKVDSNGNATQCTACGTCTTSVPNATATTATACTKTTPTICSVVQCASGYYASNVDSNGNATQCTACKTCTAAGANATLTPGGCIGSTDRTCTYTCSAGYAQTSTDTNACSQCTTGYGKTNTTGSLVCTACTSGTTYSNTPGTSQCTPCASPDSSTWQYTVTACTPSTGTVIATSAAGNCTPGSTYNKGYIAGTSSVTGAAGTCTACTPCTAAGTNTTPTLNGCSGTTGPGTCSYSCNTGYAKTSTDTNGCSQCATGYYNSGYDVNGLPTCTSCGTCTTSVPNAIATTVTACTKTTPTVCSVKCASGYYISNFDSNRNATQCTACTPCAAAGANATLTQGGCSGSTNTTCTYKCKTGYYQSSIDLNGVPTCAAPTYTITSTQCSATVCDQIGYNIGYGTYTGALPTSVSYAGYTGSQISGSNGNFTVNFTNLSCYNPCPAAGGGTGY